MLLYYAISQNSLIFILKSLISKILTLKQTNWTIENLICSSKLRKNKYKNTFLVLQKGLAMYINDPKCLRMSQHHLGLHNIQLVFHFCLYMPCDTRCRTFFRMAPEGFLHWCDKYKIFTVNYFLYKEARFYFVYSAKRT